MTSPYAIYTAIAPEALAEAMKRGVLTFSEGKRWTSASRLFDAARVAKEQMVVLFSDAAQDSSRLIAWALSPLLCVR